MNKAKKEKYREISLWNEKEILLNNFRENSWPFAQHHTKVVVCVCVGKVQGVWHLSELHFFVHSDLVLSHLETRKLGDIFTTGNPFCKWTEQLLSGKYHTTEFFARTVILSCFMSPNLCQNQDTRRYLKLVRFLSG